MLILKMLLVLISYIYARWLAYLRVVKAYQHTNLYLSALIGFHLINLKSLSIFTEMLEKKKKKALIFFLQLNAEDLIIWKNHSKILLWTHQYVYTLGILQIRRWIISFAQKWQQRTSAVLRKRKSTSACCMFGRTSIVYVIYAYSLYIYIQILYAHRDRGWWGACVLLCMFACMS